MDNLISVIIPVYNAENYLARCLDSVVNNSYKCLEIILVDDGSVDNSPQICDYYVMKDNRIKVIHKSNAGTAAARNDALNIAKGDYIAFCDNDDYISPYFYESMLKALEETDADVVVSEMTRDEKYSFNKIATDKKAVLVDKHNFILGTYSGNWTRNTAPWNKLYKRELFDEIRFPSGKGYEDAYTTYKLLYKSKKIAYLDKILYCWYRNDESYSSKKSNVKKLLFREEAISQQMDFYSENDYLDVKKAVGKFYLQQLMMMLFQIRNDYVQSKESKETYDILFKIAKKSLNKYGYLCDKDEKRKFFEYLHPILSKLFMKK